MYLELLLEGNMLKLFGIIYITDNIIPLVLLIPIHRHPRGAQITCTIQGYVDFCNDFYMNRIEKIIKK